MTTPLGRFQGKTHAPREPAERLYSKTEIIRLHVDVYRLRRLIEQSGLVNGDAFTEYDAHGVLPHHIHRDRAAHTRAIRLLSRGLHAAMPNADTIPEARRL